MMKWNIVLSAILVLLLIIPTAAALTIQEVDVTDRGSCDARIRFDTDLMSNGTVHYSMTRENPSLYQMKGNSTIGFFHSIHLTGLTPETTYYYYVSAQRQETNNNEQIIVSTEKRNGNDMFQFTTRSTADSPCQSSSQQPTTSTQQESTVSEEDSPTSENSMQTNETEQDMNATTPDSLSMTFEGNRSVTQKEDLFNFSLSNMTDDAILRVYINRDTGNADAVPILFSGGSQQSFFRTNISSNLSASVLLNPGQNIVEFELSKNGSRVVRIIEVFVDLTRPRVEFIVDKTYTNNDTIVVEGRVTEDATVTVFVNNRSAHVMELSGQENSSLEFEVPITLTVQPDTTQVYNFSLFAEDLNGNTFQTPQRQVTIDTKKPDINFTTDFDNPYHSLLLVVRGQTEPNTRITAFNLKDGTAYQEALEAYRSGEVGSVTDLLNLEVTGSTTTTEASISLSTLIGGIDNQYTIESDGDGKFSDNCIASTFQRQNNCLMVSLFPGENNLLFLVRDEAGNLEMTHRSIMFEAGDPNWRVKKPLTIIPNTIYLNEMIDSEFPTSVYIELEWAGDPDEAPQGPNGARLDASLDGGPDNGHNQYIKLPMQQKSYYDYQANPPKLYSFIDLNIHTDDEESFVENLYDEPISGVIAEGTDLSEFEKYLELKLKLNIGYRQGTVDVQEPKQQFVTVPYAVALPEDLSKYLSPEMIEATLRALDVMINVTEHGKNISDTLSTASLIGCAGSITAYALFGTSELEQAVYWTCDRVLCPTVPSGCQAQVFNQNNPTGNPTGDTILQDRQLVEISQGDTSVRYQALLDTGSEEFRRYQSQCAPTTNAIFVPMDSVGGTGSSATPIAAGLQGLGAQSTNIAGNVECFTVDDTQNIDVSEFTTEVCWTKQRDQPKCVFQATAPNQKIYPTNDLFSSLWCQCYPGASANFEYLGRVFKSMKTCMVEAQNGEIRAATCRELFFQYLCDALTWLFRQVLENIFAGATEGASVDSSVGEGGFKERASHLQDSLSSRYEDRIEQLAARGLSSNQLIHKTCVSALSGDIQLLMNDIQAALTETAVVAPTATVYATSRLGGYNPINGRITIHYNIVTSIIPGSDLEAELVMRCDRSEPGGEYCPATILEKPLTSHIGSFISEQNTIDTSIPVRMKDTKHWYNVVILRLTYSPDGEDEITLEYPATIHKKSNLLAQCSASLGGEISCSAIIGDQGLGTVELKTAQGTESGTRITPGQQNTNYHPLNPLMFLLKVDNNYDQEFYVGMQQIPPSRSGATCKMYPIPSKLDVVYDDVSPTSGIEQTYLLLYEKLGQRTQGQLAEGYRGEQTLPSGNDQYLLELEGSAAGTDNLFLTYQGIETQNTQNVIANFYYDIVSDQTRVTSDDLSLSVDPQGYLEVSGEITDKDTLGADSIVVLASPIGGGRQSPSPLVDIEGGQQTITLVNRKTAQPLLASDRVEDGQEYSITIRVGDELLPETYQIIVSESGEGFTYAVSQLEQKGPVSCTAGGEQYVRCDMDSFRNIPAGVSNYKIRLTRVVITNAPQSGILRVVKSTDQSIDELDAAQEGDEEIIALAVNRQDNTVYQTGTHQFTVNVYQDTNGDGLGDTPLLWNLENQAAQYSINLFDAPQECGSRPIIDFIEPLTDYVNPDGFVAGVTALDDCNNIERVKITIDNSFGVEQCSCTMLEFSTDTCDTGSRCIITPMPEYFSQGYGYYRFQISDFENEEAQEDAEMRISVEVEDTDGNENVVSRSVIFSSEVQEYEQQLANGLIISPTQHPDPTVCGTQ